MPVSVDRVLIVGGGIAGLSTAIALRQIGVEQTDVLEVNPNWSVYGVGIVQATNAFRALERLGKKKWRKEVAAVVAQLSHALEVDYTVLGGGNVRLLKKLPKGARAGANSNAMIGGRLIWETTGSPLVLHSKYRDRDAK